MVGVAAIGGNDQTHLIAAVDPKCCDCIVPRSNLRIRQMESLFFCFSLFYGLVGQYSFYRSVAVLERFRRWRSPALRRWRCTSESDLRLRGRASSGIVGWGLPTTKRFLVVRSIAAPLHSCGSGGWWDAVHLVGRRRACATVISLRFGCIMNAARRRAGPSAGSAAGGPIAPRLRRCPQCRNECERWPELPWGRTPTENPAIRT